MKTTIEIVKDFAHKKIMVIGDLMLDRYLFGEVSRISPEAPIQILNAQYKKYAPGGAANCAVNASALGAKTSIYGITGDDPNGRKLELLLKKHNIDTSNIIFTKKCKTIVKERIVSNNQQLLRIDFEELNSYKGISKDKLIFDIKKDIKKFDAILVSDYAKGLINVEIMETIKNSKKEFTPIIVDPRPKNKELFKNVTLIKPNLKEAMEMSPNNKSVYDIGIFLAKELNSNVLISRGSEGMSLFSKDLTYKDIPTEAKEVRDVSGAGDTVTSTLALAICAGATLNQAAILANQAASIVVSKFGTATVTQKELLSLISTENKKVKDLNQLKEIIKDYKKRHKKIVFTNGCFDILHPGHTKFLSESKKLGDILVVALNSDESVRKLKGTGRPVISEKERAEVISSLESVDYVTIFKETEPYKVISALKPDIYTKGKVYSMSELPKNELKSIKSTNCKVVFIPKKENFSTTNILQKVNNSKNGI
ncbi:bifunctional heptose 7-phosphate kinase/heptose 1-phosphate adenyltransferase [Candidatus Woesearchaeota archaeon]|nr:bifunctional heptose 7-phosphate kinase/heptose 1-phosphate adenyltransferase [Candidatus Woesearchaeota archaeon]